jgi:threonine dehydrogenase-like Zn-dependent dehydrogenase
VKAVLLEGENTVRVREVPDPDPAGRALVRVRRAGLCGTDLKIASGAIPVHVPLIIGHEMVGTVVAAGSRGLLPEGSRMLVDPGIACGHCELCRRDRGHLCRRGALMGRDVDGGFAELVAVDELQLHPIPEAVGDDAATLLQVLGTCGHAQTMLEVFPGQSAVVVGLGVAGLLHVQLFRARGVDTVVGVTRSAAKRELAARLGASSVAAPERAPAVIAEATGGRGPDLVVEAAGTGESLAQAIELAGFGSSVLVFGITAEAERLPTYQLYFKELTVLNPRAARPRDYARGIQLAAAGTLRLEPLLSATFQLDEAPSAFAACREPSQLKVALEAG